MGLSKFGFRVVAVQWNQADVLIVMVLDGDIIIGSVPGVMAQGNVLFAMAQEVITKCSIDKFSSLFLMSRDETCYSLRLLFTSCSNPNCSLNH